MEDFSGYFTWTAASITSKPHMYSGPNATAMGLHLPWLPASRCGHSQQLGLDLAFPPFSIHPALSCQVAAAKYSWRPGFLGEGEGSLEEQLLAHTGGHDARPTN